MATPRSPLWRMANALMSERLEARLSELRGEGRSYDDISRVLYAEKQIVVSSRTLRDWCVRFDTEAPLPEPEERAS